MGDLGQGAFSQATDQMKIPLSLQCLLWPITISSSYYSSYTLFHSSNIRAAFLIGLAYPSCWQLWHGAVDVVDGLPLCVSWPYIPSPSCLTFVRLSFFLLHLSLRNSWHLICASWTYIICEQALMFWIFLVVRHKKREC